MKRTDLTDYALGAAVGLASAYFGLSVGWTLLVVAVVTFLGFVTPYYLRRLIRRWKRRRI